MIMYHEIAEISLRVNGENRRLWVRAADTLLAVLRNHMGLTGGKAACENGDCGACTVLLEDRPVKACLILAVEVEGMDILTIEGLKQTEIQRAFLENGGFQCGYCTPGFILNAYALLKAHPEADDETDKEWLQSNICRCTGYEGIKRSLKAARKMMAEGSE